VLQIKPVNYRNDTKPCKQEAFRLNAMQQSGKQQSGKGRILLRAVLPTCPGHQMAGAFSAHGSDEQIFGVKEQILGRDRSD
jgi:hypothetical protein